MKSNRHMRYIGIIGKSGIGRDKFGWLLGSELEKVTHESSGRIIDNMSWEDRVTYIRTQSCVPSSSHTHITSFASHIEDQAMLLCGSTFGLEWKKDPDKYHVLMDCMEVVEEVPSQYTIVDHVNYSKGEKQAMNIGEFIIYYGETIKNSYGESIWVRIVSSWMKNRMEDINDPTTTIIFTDIKTDAEAEFILSEGGFLIEALCPEREEKGGYDYYNTLTNCNNLKNENKIKSFILGETFEEDELDIHMLAEEIYKHFNK